MGTVFTEITLKNPTDERNARDGYIKAENIRTVTVTALVDTGAMALIINEELYRKLGLGVTSNAIVKTANGQRVKCQVTDSVVVQWKDREWPVHAVVVPGAEHVLLGAIPLEGLDLMVNPVTQQLVAAHGDHVEYPLMGMIA